MNKSKFKQIYNAFFPNGNAAKFSNYLFEAFDKEKTGYINFFQYLTALFFLTNKNGNLRDQLVIAFKVYDIGKIIYSYTYIHKLFLNDSII